MINGKLVLETRLALGLSQTDLARAAGISQPLVASIERGDQKTTRAVYRIARALKLRPEQLDPDLKTSPAPLDAVRVVGYVRLGNEVILYAGDAMDTMSVPLPATSVPPSTVALEITGDGMGSFFKGWFAHFDPDARFSGDEMLRNLCVVELTDSRMFMMRVYPGTEPNRHNLVSSSGQIIENVSIAWASPVLAIAPR